MDENRVTPSPFDFGLWTLDLDLDLDLDCDNWLCLVFLFTNNEPSIRGHFLLKLNCQKMIHHIWRNSLCQYTVELFIQNIPQTIEQTMNQLIFQSIRNTCWCLYCCENVIKNQRVFCLQAQQELSKIDNKTYDGFVSGQKKLIICIILHILRKKF